MINFIFLINLNKNMFKKNKKEEIKELNEFLTIEDFIKNSKELFKELIPFYNTVFPIVLEKNFYFIFYRN